MLSLDQLIEREPEPPREQLRERRRGGRPGHVVERHPRDVLGDDAVVGPTEAQRVEDLLARAPCGCPCRSPDARSRRGCSRPRRRGRRETSRAWRTALRRKGSGHETRGHRTARSKASRGRLGTPARCASTWAIVISPLSCGRTRGCADRRGLRCPARRARGACGPRTPSPPWRRNRSRTASPASRAASPPPLHHGGRCRGRDRSRGRARPRPDGARTPARRGGPASIEVDRRAPDSLHRLLAHAAGAGRSSGPIAVTDSRSRGTRTRRSGSGTPGRRGTERYSGHGQALRAQPAGAHVRRWTSPSRGRLHSAVIRSAPGRALSL